MKIQVDYRRVDFSAVLSPTQDFPQTVWNRIAQACNAADPNCRPTNSEIRLAWGGFLQALPELNELRRAHHFELEATPDARDRLRSYQNDRIAIRSARDAVDNTPLSDEQVIERLTNKGFTKRVLRDFQLRDVRHLIALAHGANFGVPGSGKTTVTLAINLLSQDPSTRLLVVAPKNAFSAWDEVLRDCLDEEREGGVQPFVRLDGNLFEIYRLFESEHRRFLISYDKAARIELVLAQQLQRFPTHLVLDESHRIKSGEYSARGRAMLSLATLPVRRDILSGTPAPNAKADLVPQLDFLWPGMGLGQSALDAVNPRAVLEPYYVRTTKHELGLPAPIRRYVHVGMAPAQLGLYALLRSEALVRLSALRNNTIVDLRAARRSVMRLLQASANPIAAVIGMANSEAFPRTQQDDLFAAVLAEGDSPKLHKAVELARANAREDRKTVIWSVFRHSIDRLSALAEDLHPVVLHGGVPAGSDDDPDTREGRVLRFHDDAACMCMIANPAACSEGISLHRICHEAVYLDRSYNAAHYLQSVDRIHRLGLPAGIDTRITILQSVAPERIGSIDYSVSKRLAAKMRTMEDILDDPDIRTLALDEEEAEAPEQSDVQLEDLLDLLEQLQNGQPPNDLEAI